MRLVDILVTLSVFSLTVSAQKNRNKKNRKNKINWNKRNEDNPAVDLDIDQLMRLKADVRALMTYHRDLVGVKRSHLRTDHVDDYLAEFESTYVVEDATVMGDVSVDLRSIVDLCIAKDRAMIRIWNALMEIIGFNAGT